jgi:hypothetical protein
VNLPRAKGFVNKRDARRFIRENYVYEDVCGLFEAHLKKMKALTNTRYLFCTIFFP